MPASPGEPPFSAPGTADPSSVYHTVFLFRSLGFPLRVFSISASFFSPKLRRRERGKRRDSRRIVCMGRDDDGYHLFPSMCALKRQQSPAPSPSPRAVSLSLRLHRGVVFRPRQDEAHGREERMEGLHGERTALTTQVLRGLGLRYERWHTHCVCLRTCTSFPLLPASMSRTYVLTGKLFVVPSIQPPREPWLALSVVCCNFERGIRCA